MTGAQWCPTQGRPGSHDPLDALNGGPQAPLPPRSAPAVSPGPADPPTEGPSAPHGTQGRQIRPDGTPAGRTLAAEIRAVEGGHHARLTGDGRHFLIVGEDHPDNRYRVSVRVVAGAVVYTCDHPIVLGYHTVALRTTVPCRHGATAARRLEREGLLRWEQGRWVPTAKALEAVSPSPDDDPFAGLPS